MKDYPSPLILFLLALLAVAGFAGIEAMQPHHPLTPSLPTSHEPLLPSLDRLGWRVAWDKPTGASEGSLLPGTQPEEVSMLMRADQEDGVRITRHRVTDQMVLGQSLKRLPSRSVGDVQGWVVPVAGLVSGSSFVIQPSPAVIISFEQGVSWPDQPVTSTIQLIVLFAS